MSDFRKLSTSVSASPQISLADIAEAKAAGFTLVVNNRPDGEAADQPDGAAIAEAAQAAGLNYCAIPIGQDGFGPQQISAMVDAMQGADGKVLAYCRSGTRSTFLWSLARAQMGDDPEALAKAAREAGYDVSPIMGAMQALQDKQA